MDVRPQWRVFARRPAASRAAADQDPLYGYQAVNVEAQEREPHSLLNWMRRMLAVRSRGARSAAARCAFCIPATAKYSPICANYDDDTVLCVCQSVAFGAGGGTGSVGACRPRAGRDRWAARVFPPIGQLHLSADLAALRLLLVQLSAEGALPAWHTPAPEPMPELRTRVFNAPLGDMLRGALAADLEQSELKDYLAKRRWFAAKDQALSSARLNVVAEMPGTGGRVVMAEVEVGLARGVERYSLPLATVDQGEAVTALPSLLALCRFRRGRRVGFITDAFASDAFAHAVIAALRSGTTIPIGEKGDTLRFAPTSLLARTVPPDAEIRRFSAEQSNSSLAIGDAMVIKIIRRLTPGIHPEVEMTRYLTEAGVEGIASLLGYAERGAGDNAVTMLIVQSFVRNQGDAWTWTLDWLRRALSEAEAGHEDSADPFAGYVSFASAIGRRLGEIHAALAAPVEDPAFTPEPVTQKDIAGWAASAAAQLEAALNFWRVARPGTATRPRRSPAR